MPAQVEKTVRVASRAGAAEKQADVARLVEIPARPVGSSNPEGVAVHRQVFGVFDPGEGNEPSGIFRDVGEADLHVGQHRQAFDPGQLVAALGPVGKNDSEFTGRNQKSHTNRY